MEIVEAPEIPIINQNGNFLFSNYKSGNQWFDENGPIEGATEPVFEMEVNGVYGLQVTLNGCTSQLMMTHFEVGVHELHASDIKVFPNPTHGDFTISSRWIEKSTYRIFNLLGEEVQNGKISQQSTNLHLNGAGLYFLKVENLIFKVLVQ